MKEYIQKEINRVNIENNEDKIVAINIGDKSFKYHNECTATFEQDFFVVKDDNVQLAIPYEKVNYLQALDWGDIKVDLDDLAEKFLGLFDDVFDDDD